MKKSAEVATAIISFIGRKNPLALLEEEEPEGGGEQEQQRHHEVEGGEWHLTCRQVIVVWVALNHLHR